jgi:N-acetylglucosaminyl-diphospho-decaprenol L-rhamnosyltransferase
VIDFSIVIVSYNTADLIVDCLASTLASEDCGKEIFVVDNASTDGSADVVRERFPGVHLMANDKNRGFAAANNQVLPLCRGRCLFFLNPDTTLPPRSLKTLGDFLERNPRVGLAGARMVNPDGTDQESVSRRYPGEKFAAGELTGLPGRIACVLGAAMAARTDIIRAVNGFDESFFLYGEDEDLCLRIRKAGYEIGYAEDAVVMHIGGQSERQSPSADRWRKKVRAEYQFYRKHYRPETVARIRRADVLKARWRIFSLQAMMPFLRDKTAAREKLTRYWVIYEETQGM